MMTLQFETFFISLPASDEQVTLYSQIRLASLSTNPEAFGSTYKRESNFSRETWVQRLNVKGRTTFITTTRDPESGKEKWVATLSLLAPEMLQNIPPEPPYPAEISKLEKRGELSIYLLVGMWVAPEHRGKGVGRKLVESVISEFKSKPSTQNKRNVLLLQVGDYNVAARGLYRRCGFTEVEGDLSKIDDEIWMMLTEDAT